MGTYYKVVFDETRCCIDPMELGDLCPKRPALPLWTGLVLFGVLDGWGKPRYLHDGDYFAWERIADYEDRTMLAYRGADEMGLVSSELRSLAAGAALDRSPSSGD